MPERDTPGIGPTRGGEPGAGARVLAYGAVVAGAVLWGTTGTTQALAPEAADSTTLGAVRAVIGGLLLCLLVVLRRRGAFLSEGPRPALGGPVRPAVLAGGASIVAYQLCFFHGVRLAGVAVGTLVGIGSVPVLTGLAQTAVRRRLPDRPWFVATGLALVGTTMLILPGGDGGAREPGRGMALGVGLAIGAGASYTLLTFASKALLDDGYRPIQAMAYCFGVGGLLMLPALLVADLAWVASPRGLAVVIWLGCVATAAAYVLFARGLRRLEPPTVATLTLAEPLTAAALGLTLLGERPGPGAIAGAGLVLLGLLVVVGAPLLASRRGWDTQTLRG